MKRRDSVKASNGDRTYVLVVIPSNCIICVKEVFCNTKHILQKYLRMIYTGEKPVTANIMEI